MHGEEPIEQPAAAPSRRELSAFVPACVFLAVIAVLLGPALTGSRVLLPHDLLLAHAPWSLVTEAADPVNAELRDTIDTYYPVQRALLERMRAGVRTDWLEEVFLGVPGLPFIGWGALSPFGLPALALPFDLAWNWGMALRLLAAMGGAYLLARDFGAGRAGGIVAGLSFGLSGYMVGWLGWPQSHVGALAPWVLWSVRQATAARIPWWAPPVLALSTLALWFGGFPAVAVWVLLAAGVLAADAALRAARGSWRAGAARLGVAAGGVALGTALAAFTLLPSAAVAGDLDLAYRESMWMARVPWHGVLTFVVPRLFGDVVHHPTWLGAAYVESVAYAGVLTLLLAGYALAWRFRTPGVPLLAGFVAVCTAVAYGIPPLPWLLSVAPVLSGHPPPRVLVLVGLFLAVLGGLGADALLDRLAGRGRGADRRVLAGLGLLAVVITVTALISVRALPDPRPPGALRFAAGQAGIALALLVASGMALAGARRVRGAVSRGPAAALVLFVALDLAVFAGGWNVQSTRDGLFPDGPGLGLLADASASHRVSGADGVGMPDTHLLYGYRDLRARGFVTRRQRAVLDDLGTRRSSPTQWDLTVLDSGRWQPWLSLLGVRGVLAAAAVEDVGAMTIVPHRGVVLGPLTEGVAFTAREPVPRAGTVTGVKVPVGTYARDNRGELVVTLVTGTQRREARAAVAGLPDGGWVSVRFPPMALADGDTLEVTVRGTAPDHDQAVAVFGRDRDGVIEPAVALLYQQDALRPVAVPGRPELLWLDNPSAWPLVTAVTDVRVTDSDGVFAEVERAAGSPGRVAVVEEPLPDGMHPTGRATVPRWRREPGRVSATVSSPDGALVVVLDQAARGWGATVDGEPARVLTANSLFLSTAVPPGAHEVVFSYVTPGLREGRRVSLAALVLLAAWSAAGLLRARRKGGSLRPEGSELPAG